MPLQEILRVRGWEQEYPLFTTVNRIINGHFPPTDIVNYMEVSYHCCCCCHCCCANFQWALPYVVPGCCLKQGCTAAASLGKQAKPYPPAQTACT